MNHNFWLFAFTSLILNITPGNDMIYVASRSTGQGVRAGMVSALGIMAGCLVHVLAAMAGLSAIIARSAAAFAIIKYIGAAYLVYLGVRSLTSRRISSFSTEEKRPVHSYGKIFWQGALTNVLNPKVALFFLAFLPQFINAGSAHTPSQIFFLGAWFNISGTIVNMLAAILFGKMGAWMSRSPRILLVQQRITGAVLVALGIKVALTSKK